MRDLSSLNVVAIGGGTGLPLVLRALRALAIEPTAVVTMADDGGSSGRLRKEMGIVPPGDVRNCLAALASPDETRIASLLGYRFDSGEGLTGHALGNLILAALTDIAGSFKEAVSIMEETLQVQGRVLPSTFDDVELHGLDRTGKPINGQESLAISAVAISEVYLTPEAPAPNPEVILAIQNADVILLGPGSLYTSIIPNLLVAGVVDALNESSARIFYFCNVANMRGETMGMSATDHIEALLAHGLESRLDTVLIPKGSLYQNEDLDFEEIRNKEIEVRFFELLDPENPMRHAQDLLTAALEEVL